MHKKKIWISAGSLAGAAVLGIGGLSTAFANDSGGDTRQDQQLSGPALERTGQAKTEAADRETDTEQSDKPLTGDVLTRASQAAIQAAGGGTVTDTEHSDETGSAYEVEVTTSDGTEIEIELDKNFTVVKKETDTED